jgi:N-acetylmuramoyl-L-alanine amidase
VPITVSHLMGDRWMVIVKGTAIEVEPGVRFAMVGDERYQLAAAPELRKGALYVPLQLVVEIIPRVAGNLAWDPERFELRAFSTMTRHADASDTHRVDASDAAVVPAGQPRAMPPIVEAKAAAHQETDASPAPTATHGTLRTRRLVVVDAGHGGPDAGMHGPIGGGPQIFEKNVTLTVAKRVGAALNARGVAVKYTRTTDTLIALDDRGRIANDAHADLFVSIHVNAANPGWKDPGAARGFETYFLAEAKTEDARRVEQMENEVVKFESRSSAQAGDPLNFVINDMAQNEHLRESNELAELIQRRLGRVHPAPNRGVKQAGFRVLVTAFMPAVLVEIGFGTNPADAAFITDPAHVDEISTAISDAVMEYLKRYERRVSTIPGVAASSGGSGGSERR